VPDSDFAHWRQIANTHPDAHYRPSVMDTEAVDATMAATTVLVCEVREAPICRGDSSRSFVCVKLPGVILWCDHTWAAWEELCDLQ
jgi:hypothetical protein